MLLGSVYTPFHSAPQPDFFKKLHAQLGALLELFVPAAVIIAGDYNAHRF